MPKFKPHKGLRKRVKITARGKVARKMSFGGHLMSHKSGNRCRRLRRKVVLTGKVSQNVKRALGNG
jgi:large subunit ribosomal protein L35